MVQEETRIPSWLCQVPLLALVQRIWVSGLQNMKNAKAVLTVRKQELGNFCFGVNESLKTVLKMPVIRAGSGIAQPWLKS